MIKQIKKRLAYIMPIASIIFGYCVIAFVPSPASISDVVESKSVIEEQICEPVVPTTSSSTKVANEQEQTEEQIIKNGWTTTEVNVREQPSEEATVLTTFDFNTLVNYIDYNEAWVQIEYEGGFAYMAKQYISDTECNYQTYSVPEYSGFKSYMPFTALTNVNSLQYLLQTQYAYTGNYGIRQVNERYCVALGSYFNTEIGQYFDLILENGTVIPCIMSDAKADKDTDSNNIFSVNNCCSEFIIDYNALDYNIRIMGNCSNACEEWNSPVKYIKVYDINIFN